METVSFIGHSRPLRWAFATVVAVGLGAGVPAGVQASGVAATPESLVGTRAEAPIQTLGVELEVTNLAGQPVEVGEAATSRAVITNHGHDTLGNLIVVNSGASCGDLIGDAPIMLSPGESMEIECDLGPVFDSFVNEITVSADPMGASGDLLFEPPTMAKDAVEVAR
ncbi:MAG: hypothetical protein H6512_02610 [Acidimicrobiia bacterium]|nr:hypothetical protein [Acidimicrobiia bacterium]